MYSLRNLPRTLQRVPMPALILFFFCCIFVIAQYPSIKVSTVHENMSKSTYVLLSSLTKKNGDASSSADGTESEEMRRDGPPPPRWTYDCVEKSCRRREAKVGDVVNSLSVCWLTCGSHGSVWPFPQLQRKGPDTFKFVPENIKLVKIEAASEQVKQLMQEAFQIKQNYLENFPGLTVLSKGRFAFLWPFGGNSNESAFANNVIKISLSSNSTEEMLSLSTDESYEISIEEDTSTTSGIHLSVLINSNTFFGLRHGLETFSQLIGLDSSGSCLQILKMYYAEDKPAFPYRGLLIDTARNFVPMNILRRIIDGMSFNKLNMLHLHLSDSNAFTFHSNRVPQMTQYGALSESQFYYPQELKNLVKYARIRGVKVIPELDAPSHAGNGWQFGKSLDMGDLAFYINAYDDTWKSLCGQPPCGILNPVNIHVYDVLERLYSDMLDVFDKDLFHMGGDEVNVQSWANQPELSTWMKNHKSYGIGLWKFFQTQAFERLRKHSPNVTAILWTSSLTEQELKVDFLNSSDYIIQVWESSNNKQIKALLDKGFSLIISYMDKFYLDWGEGTWLGREHNWPYHHWQVLYDTPVSVGYAKSKKQVLGAEAPLWSEKTGPWQVEVKLWPRAAAFAENLWSNPNRRRTDEVYSRLNYHNYRLQQRGIPTGQLQPQSCLHFNGHCKNPWDVI